MSLIEAKVLMLDFDVVCGGAPGTPCAKRIRRVRRQINQGFFRRLFIGPGGEVERVEMTEPFAALLGGGQVLTLDGAPQASQVGPDGRTTDGRGRDDGQAVDTVSDVL